MYDPLVTIIIPSFNRANIIGETLDSVLSQTYSNWECIIVDDGSTDATIEKVQLYERQDSRIKLYLRERSPKGAPTCRNIGLDKSSGEYVIYLDSDDILAPFCLSQRINECVQNPECDFLVFKSLMFNQTPIDASFYWNIETEEDDLIRFLRMDALWQTSGPIYRKEFLVSMNGFKENVLFWQDFELHLRGLLKGAVYKKKFHLPADVYIRTGSNDTISRSIPLIENKDVLLKRIQFYRELRESFLKSIHQDNKKALMAINSMLYFFCAQFLIKHSSFYLFLKQWLISLRHSNLSFTSGTLSVVYILILKLAFRISKLKLTAARFLNNFGHKNLDYYIIKQNKTTIVPVDVNPNN